MSEGIFGKHAQSYWDKGLSVIPLIPRDKKPAAGMKGWQGYLASPPNLANRKRWIEFYSEANIGLLLGAEVGDHKLIALDVDDDKLVPLVTAMLEGPLVGKIGRRGATYFVLGPIKLKQNRKFLKGADGFDHIEVLSGGRYTVMPPSIHPLTDKPFETLNVSILDTELTGLPVVTAVHLDIIAAAISSKHLLSITDGSVTHDSALRFIMQLMRAGASDDEADRLVRAALPRAYDGNTVKELPKLIEWAREKCGEVSELSARETMTARLVALAVDRATELFHDGENTAYATVPAGDGVRTHRVNSGAFKQWLRYQAYRELDLSAGSAPLGEAIASVEAQALFEGVAHPIHNRVAGDGRSVVIDLGQEDGRVVVIDAERWRIESASTFKFVRGAGAQALPEPTAAGDLLALRELLGLQESTFALILAFMLNALKPKGPYFILLVEGEQGSGKSFVCELIKRIVDPNAASRIRLPENDRDLMIQAKEAHLLNFDNTSGMKADISDALCTLSTGGGIAVRKLYTDGDLHVMVFSRPFVMNGIAGYAKRPDLLERAIPVRLEALREGARKSEEHLRSEFEQLLPSVLGALYEVVSAALAEIEKVEAPSELRMADAARWIKAAQPTLVTKFGVDVDLIDAIVAAQDEYVLEQVTENPLTAALMRVARDKVEGDYIGGIYAEISGSGVKGLPTSASNLSRELKRLRPALAKAGVHLEFLRKDRRGQKVRVRIDDDLKVLPPR